MQNGVGSEGRGIEEEGTWERGRRVKEEEEEGKGSGEVGGWKQRVEEGLSEWDQE